MSDSLDAQYDVGHGVGFWIQVIRALLLLALGLSLLFIPDKTHSMLFNAMGLFWLTTSLVLIRREARKGGNRLWLVVAIFGVLAGLLVGFGTRLGNGCTSGHGVCGMARGSGRSIAATLVFMATAMLTVFVVRHGLGG